MKKGSPSKVMISIQFILAIPVMMAILFWPAGTLRWAEGWIYLILQLLYAAIIALYFLKHNPGMIKTRMEMKLPPKLWDRIVMLPVIVAMTALLIVPALNVRFGWSSIPVYLKAIGFVGFLISSYWIFLVMKENSYLLKTVEIQKNQKVVSTGPYRYVRHPMYSCAIIMAFALALALGSVYSLIPAAIVSVSLGVRTFLEDKTLQNGLKGYKAYTKKTRYRLLPYFW